MEDDPIYIDNQEALERFGNRLKFYRKAKYKTAEDAANKLGIQRSQYGRYEAGQNITYLKLVWLLKKMNVPISEFFSDGFE